MITVLTWLWGTKYSPDYVRKLRDSVARNLKAKHDFVCMVEEAEDWPPHSRKLVRTIGKERVLLQDKGCFARLRLFDPEFRARIGNKSDVFVQLDLDVVVTGSLDVMIERAVARAPYSILQGVNAANPCPFNGSVQIIHRGADLDEVWNRFSLEAARKVPFYEFPDDQGWIAHWVPDAGELGPKQGVYAFEKPGWPQGHNLPTNACIVAFPGKRDPSQYTKLGWVRENWCENTSDATAA